MLVLKRLKSIRKWKVHETLAEHLTEGRSRLPLKNSFFVFVRHVTLDVLIEAEQFSKLAFFGFRHFFLSFLGFRTIVIANLGSFACNFSLSENHPKLRSRRCANLCLSKIFLRRDMWVFDVRKYMLQKKNKFI